MRHKPRRQGEQRLTALALSTLLFLHALVPAAHASPGCAHHEGFPGHSSSIGRASDPIAPADTLRALFVFAKFTDGDDMTPCDTTDVGWPDASAIPTWADSIIEDTNTPVIEGSLTHFFHEMSGGQHLLKGRVWPEVITLPETIEHYDTTYTCSSPGNCNSLWEANLDVLSQVVDSLGTELATDFDENGDGYLDYMFVYYRSPRSTELAGGVPYTIHKQKFAGISQFTYTGMDSTIALPNSESISIDRESGSVCFWKVFDTGSGEVRIIDRLQVFDIASHEYGHDVFTEFNHLDSMGPFAVMEGTLPFKERARNAIASGWARYDAGWISPTIIDSTVTGADTTIVLKNAATEGSDGFAIVKTHVEEPGVTWPARSQFFLLECRNASQSHYLKEKTVGNCTIPEAPSGLLITHVATATGTGGWDGGGPPLLDPELVSGMFDTNGAPDPIEGEDYMQAFEDDDNGEFALPVPSLFGDDPGAVGHSNAFTPFTNPNTNAYASEPDTIVGIPVLKVFPEQDVYTGISIYDIHWANPGRDSMYVSIRFDGSAAPATADTIQTDMTWNGRVQLTGDVLIDQGVTVTVEPGAEIIAAADQDRFASGQDTALTEIIVRGTLEVEGNADTTISFTSSRDDDFVNFRGMGETTAADAGDWYGIYAKGSSTVDIDHAAIDYGKRAIDVINSDNINVDDTTIRDFSQRGINLDGSDAEIRSNTITGDNTNPKRGISSDASNNDAWPEIVGNTISGVRYGVYLKGGGTDTEFIFGPARIDSNTVAQSNNSWEWYGIYVDDADDKDNLFIRGNDIGPADSAGIFANSSRDLKIEDCNRIDGAQHGIWTDNSQAVVSGNLIENSEEYGVKAEGDSPTGDWDRPDLGDTTNANSPGENNILDSGTLEVWVEDDEPVLAQNNWWGTATPDSTLFTPGVDFSSWASSAFSGCSSAPGAGVGVAVSDDADPSRLAISLDQSRLTNADAPAEVYFSRPWPNPSAGTAWFAFGIPQDGSGEAVEVSVVDVAGRKITTLLDGTLSAGVYRVPWDGRTKAGEAVSSGVYFVVARRGDWHESRKVIRLNDR